MKATSATDGGAKSLGEGRHKAARRMSLGLSESDRQLLNEASVDVDHDNERSVLLD